MRSRPASPFLACLLVLAVGCGSRDDRDQDPPPTAEITLERAAAIIAARGAGEAAPPPRDLRAAEMAVTEALGDTWPADGVPAWTTVGLLDHALGLVVCQHHAEQGHALHLALIDDEGTCAWRKQLEIGVNFRLAGGELAEVSGLEHRVLVLRLANPNATNENVTHLIYAVGPTEGLLIRAENPAGRWAAAALHANHPNLAIDYGKLHAKRIDLQLAALVALSQPAQQEVRHDSKIRTTLTSMAGSVANVWLAEAAAQVLTLP